MTVSQEVWQELESLAERIESTSIAQLRNEDLLPIEHMFQSLRARRDFHGLIRLREMFAFLIVGESYTELPFIDQLAHGAIDAARQLQDDASLGRFLHNYGQHLHRVGQHKNAIAAFLESASSFERTGNHEHEALESYYMTALCHRALYRRKLARDIIEEVLERVGDDPWRAHPLTVLAWLVQDDGDIRTAEALLDEAVKLHEHNEGPIAYVLIQAYADLAEVKGLLNKADEASQLFQLSLSIAKHYPERAGRLVVRTLVKQAMYLAQRKRYDEAMALLKEGNKNLGQFGRYLDYVWRVDFAQAYILLRQGNLIRALQKLRSVYRIRRTLQQPVLKFLLEYVSRFIRRKGPPR